MKKKERLAKKRDRRVRREVNRYINRIIDSSPSFKNIAEISGDRMKRKKLPPRATVSNGE